jgi:acetyl esterase/lipase
MRRREFIVSALCAGGLRAEPGEPRTFVYKKAGDCDIKADIFQTRSDERRPTAVWLHGGALIMGSRRLPQASRMLQTLLHSGFTVVSFDYRLAPETKLRDIIEDVQDAFRWLRWQAGMLNVDPDRFVVCGGSAGGYLTLMSGFCVQPAPRALVSYWGYGDILGEWYSRPDPFYGKQSLVSREEALASIGKTAISEADGATRRSRFYLCCRQQGIWPKEVAGRDPDTERSWFERYCPIHNVTRAYPQRCWSTAQRIPTSRIGSRKSWRKHFEGRALNIS